MYLLYILFFGTLLRLLLSPTGFHIDILSIAGWGERIYFNGTLGFYENNIWLYAWPTQPPLVNLLYGFDKWLYVAILEFLRQLSNIIVAYRLAPSYMVWFFEFTKWFDSSRLNAEAAYPTGYLITIKLPAILADTGIAYVVYKIAGGVKTKINAYFWPVIYLFSPFSFYISALWGQYDQLSYLPLILAFLFESKKKLPMVTPLLLAISIAIKPTSLILLPFFIYIYFKNKHKRMHALMAFILILLLYYSTTAVFTHDNLVTFSADVLYKKIFLKSAGRLSANSFNLWQIFMAYGIQTDKAKFLFVPAFVWSFVSYIFLNILAFKNTRKVSTAPVVFGMYLVGFGSWLFMTNMVDRYAFIGIVTGLIASIYKPDILKYWLIMSIIFAINLYNQWWFPESFTYLKSILIWQNSLSVKFLSAVNIFLFIKTMRKLIYN